MSVSICGSSRYTNNSHTFNLVRVIANELKNNNIKVICGAGRGVMSAVGLTYSGGYENLCIRVGISQDFEENAEDCYRFDGNGTLHMVETLNDQSNYIISNGDVIMFFPGGSGTMGEFFNMMSNKLYINKTIICIGQFYQDLINIMIENDRREGTDNFRFINYIDNKIFVINNTSSQEEVLYRIKNILKI